MTLPSYPSLQVDATLDVLDKVVKDKLGLQADLLLLDFLHRLRLLHLLPNVRISTHSLLSLVVRGSLGDLSLCEILLKQVIELLLELGLHGGDFSLFSIAEFVHILVEQVTEDLLLNDL